VQLVCDATAAIFPELFKRTKDTPGFEMIGARMIWEWENGIKRLSNRATKLLPSLITQATS
jgi:serine/threonine-protein kinase HipA